MRVYISGVCSTGKTTLVNYIKDNLELFKSLIGVKNVVIIDELARKFFEQNNKGYETYAELLKHYDDAMDYWSELITEFKKVSGECSASNYVYIIDRGPIDYSVNLTLNYIAGSKKQLESRAREYASLMDRLTGSYDSLTFMTHPDYEVEEDGFRPTELLYKRTLEIELFRLANRGNSDIIYLPGSTEARFARIVHEVYSRFEDKSNLKGISRF